MGMKPSSEAGRFGLPGWGIAASCAAGATVAVVIWQTWGIPFSRPQPETLGVMIRDGKPISQIIKEGVISPRRNLVEGIPEEALRPTGKGPELNLTPVERMRVPPGMEFTPRMRVTREKAKVDK